MGAVSSRVIDEDGDFEADFDVPDGTYDVVLRIGSALPAVQRNVALQDGGAIPISFFDLLWGDIDGDNEVTLYDFGLLVRNFGRIGEE